MGKLYFTGNLCNKVKGIIEKRFKCNVVFQELPEEMELTSFLADPFLFELFTKKNEKSFDYLNDLVVPITRDKQLDGAVIIKNLILEDENEKNRIIDTIDILLNDLISVKSYSELLRQKIFLFNKSTAKPQYAHGTKLLKQTPKTVH